MKISDAPFSIVALAPFLREEGGAASRPGSPVKIENMEQAFASLAPSIYLSLPNHLCPEGGIQLSFRSLDDFSPASILERTPWLRSASERSAAGDNAAKRKSAANDPLSSLLDMVALPDSAPELPKDDNPHPEEVAPTVTAVLKRVVSDLSFRRLEAAWRGLGLLFGGPWRDKVSVSILPVTDDSAIDDITGLSAALADNPPDLLLLDLGFDVTPRGMNLLDAASGVAEQLMSPLLCFCDYRFFQVDSWEGMDALSYLPNYIDGFSYAKWKSLRAGGSAFWTAACCNGFPVRPPYPGDASSLGVSENRPPVAGPVWPVAALILKALDEYGKPGRGSAMRLTVDRSDRLAEAEFPQERIHQMMDCGLLPLMQTARGKVAVPALKTVDGTFLSIPLGLSRVIHILIRLRQEYGPSDDAPELAAELEEAFSCYLSTSARSDVASVTVTGRSAGQGGGIELSVTAALSADDDTQRIEFTFAW